MMERTKLAVRPARKASKAARTRATSGFQEEQRAHLQRRLRLLSDIVLVAMLVGPQAIIVSWIATGANVGEALRDSYGSHPMTGVLLLITGASSVLLRRSVLTQRVLLLLEALLLHATFANFVLLYILVYKENNATFHAIVPILVLAILSRAIVVPSTARCTLVLSLPAPLAILIVQLAHGRLHAGDAQAGVQLVLQGERFVERVVFDQFLLWFAIGLAVVASRISLGQRRTAYEAKQLGPYKLEERIGEGAMGEVYRACHALLKRPTAIKFLRPEITGEQTLKRFEREVQQTCRLTHPNTISIFDYGRTPDGVFHYAMELLDGATLRDLVERHGPMPPARAIYVLVQCLGALNEAHAKGIIHRDLKPANIMLCEQGGEHDFVKVLDFGLVKDLANLDVSVSIEGAMIGTPETMSPEMLSGDPVGPASDLYSLSCVGYYILTGRRIFDVENVLAFMNAHQREPAVPLRERDPTIPRDLEAVILRGLEKAPAARWPTAAAMRTALLACQDAGRWTPEMAAEWWDGHETASPASIPSSP